MPRGSRSLSSAVAAHASNEQIRRRLRAAGDSADPSWIDAQVQLPEEQPRQSALLDRRAAEERLGRIRQHALTVDEAAAKVREVGQMRQTPWASGLLKDLSAHVADEVCDQQRVFRERLARALDLPCEVMRWDLVRDGIYDDARSMRRRLTLDKLRAKALIKHDEVLEGVIFGCLVPRFGGIDADQYLARWLTQAEIDRFAARIDNANVKRPYNTFRFPHAELVRYLRDHPQFRVPQRPYDPTLKTLIVGFVDADVTDRVSRHGDV